jgi:DNA repair exonuclease SbcCD ATPase subunit
MANQAIIGGKTTLERLEEQWQKLLDSQERISVTEFARRADISYHTLTHNYKDWAEKVRKFRDEGRARPRKKSPVAMSREQITELEQAAEVIAKLRHRIEELTKELNAISEGEGDRRKLAAQITQLKEGNERLRGVIVSVQQEIVRYAPPDLGHQLIELIKGYATREIESNR